MAEQHLGTVERSRIMVEAVASFREFGATPEALDDLAVRLGSTRDAVSFWFESEVELLGALMKARQTVFIDALISRFAELDGAGAKLRAVLELAVDDHDATLWIELWRLSLHDEQARQIRADIVGRYRDLIRRLIAAGRDAGEFEPRSIDRATLTLIALVDGLSLQATIGDRLVTPRKMIERCVTLGERLVGASLDPV
jgi:BetI-type transcriptional repressor, C-terminal